jgi:lauroyl/myristoyl acyltransferase
MIITLFILLLPLTLIGSITVFHWFKKPRDPADTTNRINNIIAWWVTCRHPEIYAYSYKLFRQDVMETIEDLEK